MRRRSSSTHSRTTTCPTSQPGSPIRSRSPATHCRPETMWTAPSSTWACRSTSRPASLPSQSTMQPRSASARITATNRRVTFGKRNTRLHVMASRPSGPSVSTCSRRNGTSSPVSGNSMSRRADRRRTSSTSGPQKPRRRQTRRIVPSYRHAPTPAEKCSRSRGCRSSRAGPSAATKGGCAWRRSRMSRRIARPRRRAPGLNAVCSWDRRGLPCRSRPGRPRSRSRSGFPAR